MSGQSTGAAPYSRRRELPVASNDNDQSNPETHDLEKQKSLSSQRKSKEEDRQEKRAHFDEGKERQITIRERLRHFTWAWFTLTMSTGGIALLLSVTPHRFHKLSTLGTIVYILDLVLFVLLCVGITTRFVLDPKALRRSLSYPSESLFFGTFWLSLPTIIGGMQKYGVPNVGPWLPVVLRVLFWIYCACSTMLAVWQYWFLFTGKQLTVQSMTPSWVLPIFPAMLTGTLASIIAPSQPFHQRMPIIVAGVAYQGLGLMVAMLMYAVLIPRLMQYGLPAPNMRPGLFICVGPPSFTALALIGISNALPENYSYFATNPVAIGALQAMALFVGIFLWAFSFWWFCIAMLSTLAGIKEMSFHLVWWSFVFPNTGFTIATIDIGEKLQSQGVQWVGSAMTILLVAAWLLVLASHIRALVTRRMLMPGMDEDTGEEKEDDDRVYAQDFCNI